jgi:trimeric autotransporter adhesin
MSAHARHLIRTAAIALAVSAIGLLAAVMDASAYYTARGTTSAGAAVATLPAPSVTATNSGAGTVALSWTAVAPPASGSVAYYVSRDGGTASAACPSAAAPTSVTSCTDTGVSAGAHAYTVTAVWRTWTRTSASARTTVAYGVATQLVFTTQPAGATGGTAFTTQPVLTARDANGNTVLDYNGSVALSLTGGTAGAALSGCAGTLRSGVTTFSGCKIDKAGTAYVLGARDGALSASSASFNVTVGAAAQLLFTTQPAGATGATAFTTQPVVTAADAGGNSVTTYAGTVTLTIASGTGTVGAALSGCTGTLTRGVTTFTGCKIDKAGTGYRLRASDTRIAGDSAAFDVTPGAVATLAFTTQPGGATSALAFPTQPVVTAQDAGGNTVTSYNRTIALTIANNTGTKNAVLSGCSGTLVNGVTTFAGCAIDLLGSGYQLRANDGTRSATSAAFDVTVGPAASFVFTTSPSTSTAGTAFGTQPVLAARDAGGNAVTTYAGTITLSVGSGPAGATLSGCSSTVRSGVTTFSGCKLDKSGSYVLHASDGPAAGDSASFTVNAGSAASLAFTTQPVDALINTAFPTSPAVTAFDAFGNVATSYSSSITLTIKSGTGAAGASLTNCSSSRSNGVTTFTGCRINTRGNGYQLRATDGTRTADSTSFNVR